jgi:hypothetical protein
MTSRAISNQNGKERKSQSHLLTERDLTVLNFFSAIRFAETSHFAASLVPALFPTEEKLRRRLRKLAEMGYVDRPARKIARLRLPEIELAIEKRKRGRPQDIWALAQRGAEVLKLPGDWNKNNGRLRSSAFPHRLMISRVYSTLMVAESRDLISLEDWMGENTWRGRISVEGESLPLIPDGVFVLSDRRSNAEAMFFLEVDNSTEPLQRSSMVQSSFLKKCIAYWHYWIEELRPRREGMIVLTVAKTAQRAEALRRTAKAVDEQGRGLNLSWFTSEAAWEIRDAESFLYKPIWTTGSGAEVALFGGRDTTPSHIAEVREQKEHG